MEKSTMFNNYPTSEMLEEDIGMYGIFDEFLSIRATKLKNGKMVITYKNELLLSDVEYDCLGVIEVLDFWLATRNGTLYSFGGKHSSYSIASFLFVLGHPPKRLEEISNERFIEVCKQFFSYSNASPWEPFHLAGKLSVMREKMLSGSHFFINQRMLNNM